MNRIAIRLLTDVLADGLMCASGVAVLWGLHAALRLMHLPMAQSAMLESLHLSAVYALILIATAGAISRLLVSVLQSLGHWETR